MLFSKSTIFCSNLILKIKYKHKREKGKAPYLVHLVVGFVSLCVRVVRELAARLLALPVLLPHPLLEPTTFLRLRSLYSLILAICEVININIAPFQPSLAPRSWRLPPAAFQTPRPKYSSHLRPPGV